MTSLSARHFLKPLSSVNAGPYMATCLLHYLLLRLLQLLPAVRQLARCEHLSLMGGVVPVVAVMPVVPARYSTLRSVLPSNTHRHRHLHLHLHLGNNLLRHCLLVGLLVVLVVGLVVVLVVELVVVLVVGLVVRLMHCPCNLTRFHHPMRLEAKI